MKCWIKGKSRFFFNFLDFVYIKNNLDNFILNKGRMAEGAQK